MKKIYWVIFGIGLVLLALGTFWDLPIEEALFLPGNPVAQLFAVGAMVPIWVLVPTGAGLMFGFLLTQFPSLSRLWRVLCLGLLLFGVYGTCARMYEMVGSRHLHGLPYGVLLWMTILLFMGATALGAYASRAYPQQVFLAAFVGIAAVAGSRFLLDHGKDLWGRQRFWTMDAPEVQFTPWYRPQFPSGEIRAAMGDSIKSFPSGHSMGSISVLWLSLFPAFLCGSPKTAARWSFGLSLFALCFWCGTMLSRVILGEHFLSDVAISGILFLLLFVLFTKIGERYAPSLSSQKG